MPKLVRLGRKSRKSNPRKKPARLKPRARARARKPARPARRKAIRRTARRAEAAMRSMRRAPAAAPRRRLLKLRANPRNELHYRPKFDVVRGRQNPKVMYWTSSESEAQKQAQWLRSHFPGQHFRVLRHVPLESEK